MITLFMLVMLFVLFMIVCIIKVNELESRIKKLENNKEC